MSKNRLRLILSAIIILSLLVSTCLAVQRHRLEAANRTVELAVNYDDVQRLARGTGLTEGQLLAKLKERGVTGVLVKERTLEDLIPRYFWKESGMRLKADPYFAILGDKLKAEYTYYITQDKEIFREASRQLEAKLARVDSVPFEEMGFYLVGLPNNRWELDLIGVGFPEKDLQEIVRHQLNIIPQVRSWPNPDAGDFEIVFAPLLAYRDHISAIAFNDRILPGYRLLLDTLAGYVRDLDAPVAQIEFYDQAGLTTLVRAVDGKQKKVVRLHSISSGEMAEISPVKAIDRYSLAATERNERIIFTRFFFNLDSPDWLEENLAYVESLHHELERQGFTFGRAKPFGSLPSSRLLVFLTGLGVVAGGIILLDVLGLRVQGVVLGVLGVVFFALLLLLSFNLARKLMALAAVIIFPTLAVTVYLGHEHVPKLSRVVAKFVKMSLLSLVGALLMVGLLADVNFMVKLDQFAGVKAAHLIPVVLLGFIFLFWREREDAWQRAARILRTNITVQTVLVLGALFVIGIIYVTRTGNEATAVSALEMEIRSQLDKLLYVRPRTKEFLVGHPLMLWLLSVGYRHQWLPVLLVAAIGQISLVNTFAHIHTPLVISFIRFFNGMWLGILLGVILILLWRGATLLGRRYRHE